MNLFYSHAVHSILLMTAIIDYRIIENYTETSNFWTNVWNGIIDFLGMKIFTQNCVKVTKDFGAFVCLNIDCDVRFNHIAIRDNYFV
jgi:hypothetical protein